MRIQKLIGKSYRRDYEFPEEKNVDRHGPDVWMSGKNRSDGSVGSP